MDTTPGAAIAARPTAPLPLKILAGFFVLVSAAALFGGLFVWGEGFILSVADRLDVASPVADILVNAPASFLAGLGLWRMRKWGYALGWFVAGFYLYASVEIFVHVWQGGPPYAMAIVIPQVLAVLAAFAVMAYSWRLRERFV